MTVRIINADVFDGLKKLPDNSVHCVVTSPPYFGLRAYGGEDKMIGLETTLEEHIDKLLAVFREVRRVMRDDATLWLNYGDGYWGWQRAKQSGMVGRESGPGHASKRSIIMSRGRARRDRPT